MADAIKAFTLSDVGPKGGTAQAEMVAGKIVEFIGRAEHSLVLALYDIRLPDPAGSLIADAFREAAERGVEIRLAYNDVPEDPDAGNFLPTIHPPPETNPEILAGLPIAIAPISGIPDLMHHKYMVRDEAAVWTGSANWSIYSWTRQENVLASVESAELAREYLENFEELWKTRSVERSGGGDPNPIPVGEATVRAWFTPGHGEALAQRIASRLGTARRRIRIASPVLTSGPILGTLAELAGRPGIDIAGVIDEPQTDRVFEQWATTGSKWKIPLLTRVIEGLEFSGKRSVPWGTGATRDFMHAKVTVIDDTVFMGSFNLSRSGEKNAENMIEVEDPALAETMAGFIDAARTRYPRSSVPHHRERSGGKPD
ncbi:MAG: phosphatidylserine/phosphatidylglycerophosphate/cardiolipin synthase family protein [Solirubrobacterales bacterium]|nr:phosphatidylserine/phosphatidylglycerophosphate/cardiolipin synthase family protein [Solirubrobacterales bacterium]